MIKHVEGERVYYFASGEHFTKAFEDKEHLDINLLRFAIVAINRYTNTIIKCRYSLEDTFDKFFIDIPGLL